MSIRTSLSSGALPGRILFISGRHGIFNSGIEPSCRERFGADVRSREPAFLPQAGAHRTRYGARRPFASIYDHDPFGPPRTERAGGHSPFDMNGIYESFIQDISWIRCAGDLGLTIWLTATYAPDHLQGFLRGVNLDSALGHYPDGRQGRTTELAWFLAGLSHAAMTSPKLLSALTDIAVETYHRIEENQGEYGFFGDMHVMKSLPGLLRGRIGSFADQIYPIYAMSKFADYL